MSVASITSLADASDYFLDIYAKYPERHADEAQEAAWRGAPRAYPALQINHLAVPDDPGDGQDELVFPEVRMPPHTPEGCLARQLIGKLEALKLLNPIDLNFGPGGVGSSALIPCFGIPLDKAAQHTPAFHLTVDEFLAMDAPDAEHSGPLPEMRERIELIKRVLPVDFKIGLPDMQGPFNMAHAIFGNEVFTAPLDDEDKFRAAMTRITDFWIALYRNFRQWIGEERFHWGLKINLPLICECSVNMVSAEFYKKHILEHDRRIADLNHQVAIHPCSGPHVFKVTLENLPVAAGEAGFIACAVSGSISVDEALELANKEGKPLMLAIGQELPEGREYEFIKRDIDRYAENKRLTFGYTGMHWRKKDRPLIRDIHRRLDDYWAKKYDRPAC